MVDIGLSDIVTVPPTQLDIAEWVMESYYLHEKTVHNTWIKKEYAWLTKWEEIENRNGIVHIGENVFYDDVDINSDVNSNVFEGGFEGIRETKIISIT